jgi:hypothetical protein
MKNFLLLIPFLLPAFVPAQEPGEDLVEWSSARKLTWADYKGKPNPQSDAAASTTTYLGIEYNIKRDYFTYKVRSLFSRDRSWGLHKTVYILSHEQGHFDIAEVYARKLHKKMSEYKFDRKSYQKDLKKIYDDIIEEKQEMQDKYDKETNHSILKVKQEEWLKKIQDMLDEYKDYANY